MTQGLPDHGAERGFFLGGHGLFGDEAEFNILNIVLAALVLSDWATSRQLAKLTNGQWRLPSGIAI